MINEGIDLLERRFATTVGFTPSDTTGGGSLLTATTSRREDDLSPIEMFYAGTTSSLREKSEENTTFLVDRSKAYDLAARRQEERENQEVKDRMNAAYRDHLKQRIEHILTEEETEPLSRYLQRHMRERVTVERMELAATEISDKPYYISYSFLMDGIYPVIDGLHKRNRIARLRMAHFRKMDRVENVQWSAGDANKLVTSAIFGPMEASSMYENNLQRLFLYPPFDIKETQKLNPRGVILAYMALYAPDRDPVIDVAGSIPTTLRALFSNVLDGTLYRGITVGELKGPFEISDMYDRQDVKVFCDRLMICSYFSVLLTFLGVKAWRAERYPKDRFVINSKGFDTIKLPYGEVIYDRGGTWMFNNKLLKTICYTNDFETLLYHIYRQ